MGTVSVCIPTFNRARYLEGAIRSMLAQTLADFELIVSDNSQNDDAQKVVRAIDSPRVRYIRNEVNVGMVENWNRCLRASSGDYILIFHDDDRALPQMLELEKRALDADPRVGFVHTAIEVVDADGKVTGQPRHYEGDHVRDAVTTFKGIYLDNRISCPTVMVRRECYEKAGNYDHRLPFAVDWDMWLRIALEGFGSAYISRPLIRNMVHTGSATSGFARARLDKLEHLKMLHKTYHVHLPRLPVDKDELARLRRKLGWKIAKVWVAETYHTVGEMLLGRTGGPK